jgi:CRISPR-associated protein Cmr4
MDSSVLVMYAVTPCHAGSGSSLGTVDLPIQRERHTNWPVIQSSGMKGAMRAHFDRYKERIPNSKQLAQYDELTNLVFGKDDSAYAGSLSISDAKILAFPMRSSVSPFVWITCPAVLKRLERDLKLAGASAASIDFSAIHKKLASDQDALCLRGLKAESLLLEDADVNAVVDAPLTDPLAPLLAYIEGAERLLLVNDAVFNYGVESCTQISAQIKIESASGTTTDGSLRYQEDLPSDTVMYCLLQWGNSRDGDILAGKKASYDAQTIQKWVKTSVMSSHLQVGGDETLGRGIFELSWK